MKDIVLGVSGSVACYRACDLARELMRSGHRVRACLTDSAEKFVTPALFEALTGQPCLQGVFEEPVRGRMAHIDLARQANLLVIAPATANVLNKLAAGVADDMLTTLALVYEGPLIVAPAMNPSMYAHETTQQSLKTLSSRGAFVVEPSEGEVACGEQGQGKLASVSEIHQMVDVVSNIGRLMEGKRVLITSGPTQEPIDDVRFITNRSSGKMGAAVAKAALMMGADVTVVSGPAEAPLPKGAKVVAVQTGKEMLAASLAEVSDADYIIGVAAVGDFTVANRVAGKLRRSDGAPSLEIAFNPDVIAELAHRRKSGSTIVAFAAEPDAGLEVARQKRATKGVDAIVANDVSDAAIGFHSEANELILITETEEMRSPRMSKFECALWLWREIVGAFPSKKG